MIWTSFTSLTRFIGIKAAWKWVKYIPNINDNKHAFLLRFTDNRQVDKLTSWRDMLPPPPHPPIISKASPSLKDTIMKDHRKGTHFPDIVTGLTMGSTTFEEVGVWWFRSGQEFFAAVRDFFFSCYCKYKTINCNCIFFPPSLFARNLFDHPA